MKHITIKNSYSGFTLVEVAIVLVILGLILSFLLLPLQAQREQAALAETNAMLQNAKNALLGFAQSRGRLPCPATLLSNGAELPLGGTSTANPTCVSQSGFLPAATLGIQPIDGQGFALDAWNNRIRYAVTQASVPSSPATADFTSNIADNPLTPANEADGMNAVGLANLMPNLTICRISPVSSPLNCSNVVNLINNAVVVIYSIGATGAQGSAGRADETENLNAVGANQVDQIFVSRDTTTASQENPNEFDHIVAWISPFVLYNSMIQAGQLH